jgi:ubiquinone/menaquinone biosynthesis C-methylase UbiE
MNNRTAAWPPPDRIVYSIAPSLSDILLRAWGFDLRSEYLEIIRAASAPTTRPVLELATGSGRMASVLNRAGYVVMSGDRESTKLPEALTRIGSAQAGQVLFLRLDLESLPFPSGSIDTVFCVNTLHELERPRICLDEILRVHSGKGPLVLGDFNEEGFEVMQRLHQLVYKNDHHRGLMSMEVAHQLVEQQYSRIDDIKTPLNLTLLATGRKASSRASG